RLHGDASGIYARRRCRVLHDQSEVASADERRERFRHEVLPERGQQYEHLAGVPPGASRGIDDRVLNAVCLRRRCTAIASPFVGCVDITYSPLQENGTNDVHWLKVLVDSRSREAFSYQPQIVPAQRTAAP